MENSLSAVNQSIKVGKKLKEYFDELGYTQQYVADKLGVSQAAVSALLNGKPFGKKLAAKWAEAFGFNPNWLLTGEGEMSRGDITETVIKSVTPKGDVTMSREVFDQFKQFTETILSQQRTIEKLTNDQKGVVGGATGVARKGVGE